MKNKIKWPHRNRIVNRKRKKKEEINNAYLDWSLTILYALLNNIYIYEKNMKKKKIFFQY